jgi:hypothetical protein
MKLISALVGLAALGGIALATAPASAMPMTVPGQASQASNIEQASYACNDAGTGPTSVTATTIRITGAGIIGIHMAATDMAGITGTRITTAAGVMAAGTIGISGNAQRKGLRPLSFCLRKSRKRRALRK